MKNVEMTVEGETLTIKVDLSKDFGKSKSGKTIIVASTEGNVYRLGACLRPRILPPVNDE